MEDQVTLYSPNELDSAAATADATQGDQQYDPSAVVLDCQFCGACVALWPFSIVERPLQLFKLIADSNGQVEQNNGHGDLVGALGLPKSASVGFNFTIAGGPPPTRQNFRPRVSFPVVSRYLKADLSSCGKSFSSKPESDRDPVALQSAGSLKRKRSMNEPSILESDNASGHTSSTDVDTLTKGKKHDQQEDNSEKNIANLDKHKQECSHSDKNKDTDMEETSCGEEPETGADTIKIIRSTNVELDQHSSEPELRKGHVCEAPSDHRNLVEAHVSSSRQIEVATNTQTSLNKEKGACQTSGREALYDRMDEFDPIKQHRTFCPWIAPDNGEALPGWRLTLSALCSQEKISNGDRQVEAQTSLLDEEDDPLTCVRELFMTPSSKKSRSIQRADES